jgi:hypothetical protein
MLLRIQKTARIFAIDTNFHGLTVLRYPAKGIKHTIGYIYPHIIGLILTYLAYAHWPVWEVTPMVYSGPRTILTLCGCWMIYQTSFLELGS